MKKIGIIFVCIALVLTRLAGCTAGSEPKIGVAFGVGPAARWPLEKQYMEDYAKELGVQLEVRLNTDEKSKPFAEDCKELVDSGIDVLIIRPRDVSATGDIVSYAYKNKVKVISYASLIEKEKVDMFIGYDCEFIGQSLGRHLSEIVLTGDYILLWGTPEDRNVKDMYKGAMKFIEPIKGDINIILEAGVPDWSPDEAKRMVKDAVADNSNKVDAILAFNDKLAGASAEAVAELGIDKSVIITGTDAELDAVKRIAAGTQSCTIYMDLNLFSRTAVDQAVKLAKNDKADINYELDNGSGTPIPANLLAGELVTQANLNRVLIESGHFTPQQVYETTE